MADLGPLGGVKITGFISPTDTNDTYAVIDPIYGIDGLRNVTGGTAALDVIPNARRRAGMLVGVMVSGSTEYYQLLPEPWTSTITDWKALNIGGSDTFTGLTDTNIVTPSDGDYIVYSGNTVINLTNKHIEFSAATSGQTLFNVLPTPPINNENSLFFVNGVKQVFNSDYDITGGTTVIWITNKHDLDSDDSLNITYL